MILQASDIRLAMDDAELFQWYGYACIVWAKANGDSGAGFSSFQLRAAGTVITIASWTSSAPRPTEADLKAVGVSACQALKDMDRLLWHFDDECLVATATADQITAAGTPAEGALVINTDTGEFSIWLGGAWVVVATAGGGVGAVRPIYPPGNAAPRR